MILLMHILIALASVGVATVAFITPKAKWLVASYGFIVATIGSGTALLLTGSVDVLRTCLSGLLYVTVISIVTIASHARARAQAREAVSLGE